METLVKELVGKTRYVWWLEGSTLDKVEPFYCAGLPDYSVVRQLGCNCAGLINLICHIKGLPVADMAIRHYWAGGTSVWFDYLMKAGRLQAFDPEASYRAGALLLRNFSSLEDQGHLAILYSSGPVLTQQLLHCTPDTGITIDTCVKTSNDWLGGGYYTHVCVDWIV